MKPNKIKELAEIICRDCLCGGIIDRGKYLEWRGARVDAVIETLKEWGLEGLLEVQGGDPERDESQREDS